MKKIEFLDELCARLSHLPQEKAENARHYYSGIIDGRVQCGMAEEDAVAAIGDAENAALEYINMISRKSTHRISNKIKSMPTMMRIISSGVLSTVCFLLVGIMWVAAISVYVVTALAGLLGSCGMLYGIFMCFVRTVPVGLCVAGIGMILLSVMFLLFGPARAVRKASAAFSTFIKGKVRALLAKEALAV